MWPRPKTYFPHEKSRRWVEIRRQLSDTHSDRQKGQAEDAPERLIRSYGDAAWNEVKDTALPTMVLAQKSLIFVVGFAVSFAIVWATAGHTTPSLSSKKITGHAQPSAVRIVGAYPI
jgi:hypothetical protein